MGKNRSCCLLLLLSLGMMVGGCGQQASTGSGHLPAVFEKSEQRVKEMMAGVQTAIQSSDCVAALTGLNQAMTQVNLSAAEKDGVRTLFAEITRAVAANPKLETQEFYNAKTELMHKLYGSL